LLYVQQDKNNITMNDRLDGGAVNACASSRQDQFISRYITIDLDIHLCVKVPPP